MRGERFAGHHKDLKNFADVLCLTHPAELTEIHRRYLAAGADIIETNTFGASPIGAIEFELPDDVIREINQAAVACARRACDRILPNARHVSRGSWPDRSARPRGRWQSRPKSMMRATAERRSTKCRLVLSTGRGALVEAGVDICCRKR